MEDLFKKFLYTGVGLVATTAERVQKTVDELVEKGKLSREEGKKVVDEIIQDTEEKKTEVEDKVKDLFGKVLSRFDLPSRTEIEKLNAKIADLEAKLVEKAEKASKKS